jgi:hypothetical protein
MVEGLPSKVKAEFNPHYHQRGRERERERERERTSFKWQILYYVHFTIIF